MRYFDTYFSNTLAASGNQFWFSTKGQKKRSRVFYRLFAGGSYHYSLLFTNIVDSTFYNGGESHANLICGEWEICAASVAVIPANTADLANAEGDFLPLTFEGKTRKTVMPGAYFTSDSLYISANAGDYLCLETEVIGDCIPCLREIMIPAFSLQNGAFVSDYAVPLACSVGCDRKISARVGFLGDSITEGIGAPPNSYLHWNARIADKLGEKYGYWNLGLGYGRAADAATDSTWLNKAKSVDVCTVCYGVNDIYRGYTAAQIIENLTKIVQILKAKGIKVILFTVPPFNYAGNALEIFVAVNRAIREELRDMADAFFDFDSVIGAGEFLEAAPYGGHPNAEGGEILAEAFVKTVDMEKLLKA